MKLKTKRSNILEYLKGKISKVLFFLLIIIFFQNCSIFKSDEELMLNTVNNVLIKIYNRDSSVINMANRDNDKDQLIYISEESYYYILKYYKNDLSKIKIIKDSIPDEFGRYTYRINLLNQLDSSTGIEYYDLIIMVGPKNFVPLNEISGINADFKINETYRGNLIKEGRLKDYVDLIDELKKKKSISS